VIDLTHVVYGLAIYSECRTLLKHVIAFKTS